MCTAGGRQRPCTLAAGGRAWNGLKLEDGECPLNRTWLSIGHVIRVSPALLGRDNRAACSLKPVAMVTGVCLGRSPGQIPACWPGCGKGVSWIVACLGVP